MSDANDASTSTPTVAERVVRAITGQNVVVTVLAFVAAFLVGALLIAVSDEASRQALGYVTARPTDFLSLAWDAITDSYSALVTGALGSANGIAESLLAATPLILAGLAVTLPFRAGLFNIGGEGQVIVGGMAAAWVGFAVDGLPLLVHLPLALAAGFVAGFLMGWIPGVLKTRTGAHEVITTIMLNNIAIVVLDWALISPTFIGTGNLQPRALPVPASARLPGIWGRLNTGIVMALLTALAIWVLMERSARGFEIEAVGHNPTAATTAGMSVSRATITTLGVAAACAGLAGAGQALGVSAGGLTGGFSGGLGFDGITVALLGRARVPGTVAAGLLFGALEVGGRAMQSQAGINLDLVGVLQALVILFVAAPALVRWLFRVDRPRRRGAVGTEAAT